MADARQFTTPREIQHPGSRRKAGGGSIPAADTPFTISVSNIERVARILTGMIPGKLSRRSPLANGRTIDIPSTRLTEAKLTALATVGFFTEPPTNWKNERLVWLKLRNDAKIGQIRALLAGVELIGHVIGSRALPAYRCSRLDEIRNELLALGCELVG